MWRLGMKGIANKPGSGYKVASIVGHLTENLPMSLTFSNPRQTATFPDWPLGGNRRGNCTFTMEYKEGKGYRIVKQTTGKPKVATYGGKGAIVDGSDGKTYIIQFTAQFDFIRIMRHDFMSAGSVFKSSEPEMFATLSALIG